METFELAQDLTLGLWLHAVFCFCGSFKGFLSRVQVYTVQSDGLLHAGPSAGLNFEGVQHTLTQDKICLAHSANLHGKELNFCLPTDVESQIKDHGLIKETANNSINNSSITVYWPRSCKMEGRQLVDDM